MDLPKKRSSRNVTGVYVVFIILFAFTVSLFYTSRCQQSNNLSKQDSDIINQKDSADTGQKETGKRNIIKEQSENKFEASKSVTLTDDENKNSLLSKNGFSNGEKINIDNFKTPNSEAIRPNTNPIHAQPSSIFTGQNEVIFFSTDSTGLTDTALEKLRTIHLFLLKYPDEELIIEGYGDLRENSRHNKKLSQLRANIVKSYFVKREISNSRIKVFWLGSDNPSGGYDSQEDLNKTHQVEIQLKKKSK